MKKRAFLAAFFLLCTLLSACGKKDSAEESIWRGIAPGTDDLTSITERTEYYDITVKAEELFDLGLWEKNMPNLSAESTALRNGKKGYLLVGTQFFMGEPIQLWAELSSKNREICLYRNDGTRELLLQGVPSSYTRTSSTISDYKWYLSREGDLYCYHSISYIEAGRKRPENVVVKFLPTGEPLYCSMLDPDFFIHDFCQMDDGRIYLLLQDTSKDNLKFLAQLDPATGELLEDSRIELPYTFNINLGAAGDSPAVTGQSLSELGDKIMSVDTADGSLSPILYFTGTSYGWHNMLLWDLQVLEDGSIELLWTDQDGENCLWENLRMEKVEKTPIVVRGIDNNDWLADRIAAFNRGNSTFHVILETCGTSNDGDDFSRLTNVQIGSGKGPDILMADLGLDFTELMEKGVLEDLSPYMEASGIREEDYFPYVFAAWRQREHIYSVNYLLDALGIQIDEEVLGSRETPDIETLADALLAWEGSGIYRRGYDPGAVLKQFLQGTESLWGMVDWEKGSCDFNTPLFGKLLEAARRYGDDGRSDMKSRITYDQELASFLWFDGQAEQKAEGKVTCGVLFDDGCYAASSSKYTLVVNANSPNKEGVWELISYLIGEDCQGKEILIDKPPIHREAFKEWLPATIGKWGAKHYDKNGILVYPAYYGTDISEKKQAEYIRAIEEARPLPTRTAPILTVILEEAKSYFDGQKSAEEVSRIVNNRVQLYLDERK